MQQIPRRPTLHYFFCTTCHNPNTHTPQPAFFRANSNTRRLPPADAHKPDYIIEIGSESIVSSMSSSNGNSSRNSPIARTTARTDDVK